jgi:hypothetical protein
MPCELVFDACREYARYPRGPPRTSSASPRRARSSDYKGCTGGRGHVLQSGCAALVRRTGPALRTVIDFIFAGFS